MYTIKDYYKRTIKNASIPYLMSAIPIIISIIVSILLSIHPNTSPNIRYPIMLFSTIFFLAFITIHLIDSSTDLNRNIKLLKRAMIKKETRKLFNHSPNYQIYLESQLDNPEEFLETMIKIQPYILNIVNYVETNKKYDTEYNHYIGVVFPIEYYTTLLMLPTEFNNYLPWFTDSVIKLSNLSDEFVHLNTYQVKTPLINRKLRVLDEQIDEILIYMRENIENIVDHRSSTHISNIPNPIEFQEEVAYAVYCKQNNKK